MTTPPKDDELAGTEQPFVAHLIELRTTDYLLPITSYRFLITV